MVAIGLCEYNRYVSMFPVRLDDMKGVLAMVITSVERYVTVIEAGQIVRIVLPARLAYN